MPEDSSDPELDKSDKNNFGHIILSCNIRCGT